MRMMTIAFLIITTVLFAKEDSPLDKSKALEIFGRFKTMNGTWEAKSSKGWEGRSQFRVIARGSAVMKASTFKDEPKESMATMYHMDGNRLLLTHYCEAGNQPTLAATKWEDNGPRVVFEFIRRTNMPSRNTGHMDKVVYTFQDDYHFTSNWTWYKDGKESWLEEISYQKVN